MRASVPRPTVEATAPAAARAQTGTFSCMLIQDRTAQVGGMNTGIVFMTTRAAMRASHSSVENAIGRNIRDP
jgi:hypothetical protein